MIIGLTGQIGAGKSAAARILRGIGALIVDADRIGRQVVDGSPAVRKKLAASFGKDILGERGELKRRKLASKAFADKRGRDILNSIVHPYLLKELRRQVKAGANKYPAVVIDAALLLFWGMDREVDLTLVIHASRRERLNRMAERGISRADALARERSQLPYAEFQRRADRLILNNGSLKDLERKLTAFWHRCVVLEKAPCR